MTTATFIRTVHAVDGAGVGWFASNNSHFFHRDDRVTAAGLPRTMALADLQTQRAPLRMVIPAPAADLDQLRAALQRAGRRCIGTLAVALSDVHHALNVDLGAGQPYGTHTPTVRRMAQLLGAAVPAEDYAPAAGAEIARIVHRWVNSRDFYVEVAANLSTVLGRVVDTLGGWQAVADERIQACGMAADIQAMATAHCTTYPQTSTMR